MVEIGSPYESIAHVITNHDADLVVMGTKGSGGVEEVLIGSNTEKVVRYAKCPVITIKDKVDLDKVKHIVFATSLMEDQPDIVERLKLARENFGVKLHLVKVNTPNNFHTERQLREEFQKYLEKHDLKDCETHVYNEASEEDGILYFAEDLGDCMIAIGTHGRTGLLHLLSGSIAEDLVKFRQLISESEDLKRLIRSPVISRADQSSGLMTILEKANANSLTKKTCRGCA